METELRNMLRAKAGEVAGFSPALPVTTMSRARRRRALTGAGIGVGLAAAIVAIIAGVGAVTGQRAVDFTTKIEPKRSLVVNIGGEPSTLASGFGSVWAATGEEIIRVDARSGKVVARIKTVGKPRTSGNFTEQDVYTAGFESFAAGKDAMWIVAKNSSSTFSGEASSFSSTTSEPPTDTNQGSFSGQAQPLSPSSPEGVATLRAFQGSPETNVTSQIFVDEFILFRIDPKKNTWKETGHFQVGFGPGPEGLATGGGSVWVAASDSGVSGRVWRFDERTGKVQKQIAIQGMPMGVAFQGGFVWVPVTPGVDRQFVLKIDPSTNKVVGRVAIPNAAIVLSIAAADEDVWVAGSYGVEGTGPFFVARIDATNGRLMGPVEVPDGLARLAAGGGSVWGIPQGDPRSLVRITGNVFSGRLSVERQPFGLTIDGSRLWVGAVPATGSITRYEF